MTIDTGGPAFPTTQAVDVYSIDRNGNNVWNPVRGADTPGMTYRQWLVGLAMQGDLARTSVQVDLGVWERRWCQLADAAIRAERETREETK